jgi:peroxiredoxin
LHDRLSTTRRPIADRHTIGNINQCRPHATSVLRQAAAHAKEIKRIAFLTQLGDIAMARTASTMLPLGTKAPDFSHMNVDGRTVSLSDFSDAPALLVVFMCNHCPFVRHIADALAQFTAKYMAKGVAVVGINSNDAASYPADSPEQMVREAEERGYAFPYLYDETQETAKAYRASCTPDFFLFDGNRRLVYRGQFDDSRPDSGIPVTGHDLRLAVDAVLAGKKPNDAQRPSIGCNIKWRAGNEPDYFK